MLLTWSILQFNALMVPGPLVERESWDQWIPKNVPGKIALI